VHPAAVCVWQSAFPEHAPPPVLTEPQMKMSERLIAFGPDVTFAIARPKPFWLFARTEEKKLRMPLWIAIFVYASAVSSS
jgi:hypothetical protein